MPYARPTAACFVVAALLGSAAIAAPDLSSPKAAYKSYQAALAKGDMESLSACVIADESRLAMLKGQVTYAAVERRFRDAAIKAFPAAEKSLTESVGTSADAIDKSEVNVKDDRAMLRTAADDTAVELKKIDGMWKLDLNALYSDEDASNVKKFRDAVTEVMEGMLPDLEAGKFSTYDQVTQTLQSRVLMRTALPQEDATTKPTR